MFRILTGGDVLAVLAMIIITGFFGLWVYGRTYDQMVKDRDDWKTLAEKAVDTADRLTDVIESGKRER